MFSKVRPAFGIRFNLRELLLLVMLVGSSLALLRQRAAAQLDITETLTAMECEVQYKPRFSWAPTKNMTPADLSFHCWYTVSQVTVCDHHHTEFYLDSIQRLPNVEAVELRSGGGGCLNAYEGYHDSIEQFKTGLHQGIKFIVTPVASMPVVG